MRKNESAQVVETFRELGLGDNLHFVDASETFLAELEGATDPEKKRLIIGQTTRTHCRVPLQRKSMR